MKDSIISNQLSQVQNVLGQPGSIGIIVSENQSLDKMAAALALYLSLKASGKDVQIISKRDPLVEISNLVGINKVRKSFDGKAKMLIVSLPYKEGEIEKVSYNIEGSRLNINLFAAQDQGITFQERDVDYIKTGAAPNIIFTVGIRNAQELQNIVQNDKNTHVISIDTTTSQADFAEVTVSDSSFSSFSEIVAEIIDGLGFSVDIDIAQNILDGVSAATNNFILANTSASAFEAVAFALRNGARRRSTQNMPRRDRQQNIPQQQSMRQQHGQQQQPRSHQQNQQPQQQQNKSQNNMLPVPEPIQAQPDNQSEVLNEQSQQEDVPSDWFVPKVFKSSRTQE